MNPKVETLLKELELTRELYYNIPPETGKFLNLLIKTQKFRTVFEIGTSNGYSGIWMAEALSQIGGHLFTIESHKKERFILAKENFHLSGLSDFITPILGHAPEDIPSSPKKFDMAFFDATKNEHIYYFKALAPRIKKNGIIITDNINSHKKDLTPYVSYIKKRPNWKSYTLNLGTGILVSLKK